MADSVYQAQCPCGTRHVLADGVIEFVCECGRQSTVEWDALIAQTAQEALANPTEASESSGT